MSQEAPNPCLQFDPDALDMIQVPRPFYMRKTEVVARRLIGKWIARRHENRWYGGRIVETEAYLGAIDPAAHSWRGRRTARVEPMYLAGGHVYVFFVYGMHHCANIVTRPAGIAEAVLLRAVEGPPGAPPKLTAGPGRLCSALGISRAMSGQDLLGDADLRVLAPRRSPRPRVSVTPRIGIDYAGEARNWPLRFYDTHSPSVSMKR